MNKYPYSIGSAVIYSTVLLVTLWWIPILGPILIGYITGRKAGGPLKGLIAMIIPIGFYFFIIHAIHQGWIHIPPIFHTYLSTSFLASATALPFLNYIERTANIAMNVGLYIHQYVYYAPSSFFIMFSFAFIGGAVSRQIILERGIYKERKPVFEKRSMEEKHAPEPFNAKVLTPKQVYSEEPVYERMHRAPVEYNPYQQPVYAAPTYNPPPTAYPPHQNYPPYQQYNQYPQPQYYQPQYHQAPQYNPYPYPGFQESQDIEENLVRIPKKKTRRRKKKIKQFQVEENNRFVVHQMDHPKNVPIRKKNINKDHSIAFL